MPQQGYGRANGRDEHEQIFIFPFDIVIDGVWVAAPMPAPVHCIDGEVLRQQRHGWTPERAVHQTSMNHDERWATAELLVDDSGSIMRSDRALTHVHQTSISRVLQHARCS